MALSQILCKRKKEKKRIIIAGDFNYDLLTYTKNEKVNEFITLMYENSCQPCILKPTRIVENQRPSLIDNIFINSIESPISGNLIERISNHFPNFIIINNNCEKETTDTYKYKRNLKTYDPINFQHELMTKFDNIPKENQTVTELSNNIINSFTNTRDVHAPIVKRTRKEMKNRKKTWLTKGILNSIKIKTKWLKKYMKLENTHNYSQYKLYKDKLNKIIKTSKKTIIKHTSMNVKKTLKKAGMASMKYLVKVEKINSKI